MRQASMIGSLLAVLGGCSLLLPDVPGDGVDDTDEAGALPIVPDGGGVDGDGPPRLDDGRDSDLPSWPEASPDAGEGGHESCMFSGRTERCGNCIDEDCVNGPAPCGDYAIGMTPESPVAGDTVSVEVCASIDGARACAGLRCDLDGRPLEVDGVAPLCDEARCCWSFEVQTNRNGPLMCTFVRAPDDIGPCDVADLPDRVCGRVEIEAGPE